MTLPVSLHAVAAIRALEARALAMPDTGGSVLMRRAAAAALAQLRASWPRAREVVVLCGGGNNGGDGWTLSRLAKDAGLVARVLWTTPPEALRGEAAAAAREAIDAGVPASAFGAAADDAAGGAAAQLRSADVVVDALLGIGATQTVRDPVAAAISAIAAAGRPVLALDIPSGLCADSGRVLGSAVRADVTITFIALKSGLWLGAGPDHAGEVQLATLGLEADIGPPAWIRLETAQVRAAIPVRARTAHKGQGGHVLVIGGGHGMPGAARLAGEAALRVGAGRVTVACAAGSAMAIAAGRPELMVRGLSGSVDEAVKELDGLLGAADVLVIGPGLGRDAWAGALRDAALAAGIPAVVDADALHLPGGGMGRPGLVFTPHPGEAARLLGIPVAEVQADRPRALAKLVAQLGGVVVLKAAGTLIGRPSATPVVCGRGDPVLAAPGTGDVLAGAIAGLLAQSGDAWGAACAAVWLHARAGERLANAARRGVLAGEIAAELPATMSEVFAASQDDGERVVPRA